MQVKQLVWETPPVVRTEKRHSFKTGQNVILTGLRLGRKHLRHADHRPYAHFLKAMKLRKLHAGAPVAVRNFMESISRDHVARSTPWGLWRRACGAYFGL